MRARRSYQLLGSLLAAAVLALCLSHTPIAAASQQAYGTKIINAGDWLAGAGVDVYSNGSPSNVTYDYSAPAIGMKWQCVELAQRLYQAKGWTSGTWGVDAWAIYGNWRFQSYPNNGTYAPVAGDLIVHSAIGGWPAGHVSIVDHVSGSTVYVVEQNDSYTGRAAYTLSGGVIQPRSGHTAISGIVHDADNSATSSPPPSPPSTPNNSWGVDVNNDGADDLLWYEGTTLNTVGASGGPYWSLGFGAWQETNPLTTPPTWAGVGNLDYSRTGTPADHGDDLWWYENGTLHVYGSTGTKFGLWEKTFNFGAPTWAGVGDVNGDGADDLLWYEGTTMNIVGASGGPYWTLGSGGWQETNPLSTPPTWAGVGDLNADRKDDLWWYEGTTLHVYGSTGTKFGAWEKTFTLGAPTWAGIGDVNGDGADDLIWYEGTTLNIIGATGGPNWTLGGWQETNPFTDPPEWAGIGNLDYSRTGTPSDHGDDLWWYDDGVLHVYGSTGTKFGLWEKTFNFGSPAWASFGSFPYTNGDGMQ